ncbi:hypothetical protein Sjap_026260 [Stephania japonica]|uniref:Uncharacterized protein n=1 Tax=Stephania japonica TaxID=461633 RepID=A0AAP0E3B7_9MAGN
MAFADLRVTIILQGQVLGLQVLLGDNSVAVNPVPNAFMVNLSNHIQHTFILIAILVRAAASDQASTGINSESEVADIGVVAVEESPAEKQSFFYNKMEESLCDRDQAYPMK